eukprot:g3924.t1
MRPFASNQANRFAINLHRPPCAASEEAALRRKKKSNKSERVTNLPRSPSRLSEISTGSFMFEDDLVSSHSEQVTCGRCRCEVSASCQCGTLFLFTLAVTFAISLLTWTQLPEVTLGAFGHLKQVGVPQAISYAYFQNAKMQMLDLQSIGEPLVDVSGPGNASDMAATEFRWHTIEVIWQMGPSSEERETGFQPSVVSDTYLAQVRWAEEALKDLPDWQDLCSTEPLAAQKTQGLEWEVSFDAAGELRQLPVETLLAFAQEVRPELLDRWLPRDPTTLDVAAQPLSRQLLRSNFFFYLPSEAESRFGDLVLALREALRLRQEASRSESGGLRGFYRIDGRDYEDLDLSFQFYPFAILAAANVLLTVLLLTRRLLLAVSATALLAASAALSSQALLPVTTLSWQWLAVQTIEMALSANSILSYNGHRVLVKLQELQNLVSPTASERGQAWQWLSMWLTVPLQLIMPTLGTWITLQIVSGAIAGIPLAEEFVSVAVPGTFVILCCGPCLFIPAVLMGDWMAEAREEREDPWIPSWMLPKDSPETIAARALRNATACRIEAAMSGASGASSACSWFSCEAEKGVELAEDTCSCDYRLFTPQSGASTCQAEARFSGLHAVPETFWPWVQESPGRTAAAVSSG